MINFFPPILRALWLVTYYCIPKYSTSGFPLSKEDEMIWRPQITKIAWRDGVSSPLNPTAVWLSGWGVYNWQVFKPSSFFTYIFWKFMHHKFLHAACGSHIAFDLTGVPNRESEHWWEVEARSLQAHVEDWCPSPGQSEPPDQELLASVSSSNQ